MAKGLVSAEKARSGYGVVLGDADATEKLRAQMRVDRGDVKDFDLGPNLDTILARAQEETGLAAPQAQAPLAWAPMETPLEAMQRVRKKATA